MDERRRQRILRQHVRTDALMGVEALPVGALERIERAAGVAEVARPEPTAQPAVSSSGRGGAPPAVAATGLEATEEARLIDPPRVAAAKLEPLARETKLQILQQLDENEVRGCTRCPLHEGRTQTVFGEGDPDADVMFIGEGPGQTEDELGRPFVGRAGSLLDKMIVAMGYQRQDVYIANVVKCRPPNNRTPTTQEVDTCWGYLRRQIETIQPKVIVTLGGPAAKMILNTKEGITRLRGTWHRFDEVAPPIPVMPTFHPAYLLRSYTPENRRKVWSDLQAVMERVGKPRGGGG